MQTETVSKQIQELEAIKTQKRLWQWGATLVLGIVVVSSVLSLRNAANALVQTGPAQEAFQKALGERVQKNAIPAIENYGLEGVRGIDYSAAVKKLNARTPELTKESMKQLQLLSEDLTQRGNKVFDQTIKAALTKRENKIRAMFPEAKEEQVNGLIANLSKEAQDQVAGVNDSLFSPHKKALDTIVTDMELIRTSEAGSIKGETPSWELGLTIFDIAREDLKGLEPPADTAKTTGKSTTGSKEKK